MEKEVLKLLCTNIFFPLLLISEVLVRDKLQRLFKEITGGMQGPLAAHPGFTGPPKGFELQSQAARVLMLDFMLYHLK